MEGMPSIAAYAAGHSVNRFTDSFVNSFTEGFVAFQQRVLLFGSVRCNDLDSLDSFQTKTIGFQKLGFQKLDFQKLDFQKLGQVLGHNRTYGRYLDKCYLAKASSDQTASSSKTVNLGKTANFGKTDKKNYFTNLGAGASSHKQ